MHLTLYKKKLETFHKLYKQSCAERKHGLCKIWSLTKFYKAKRNNLALCASMVCLHFLMENFEQSLTIFIQNLVFDLFLLQLRCNKKWSLTTFYIKHGCCLFSLRKCRPRFTPGQRPFINCINNLYTVYERSLTGCCSFALLKSGL